MAQKQYQKKHKKAVSSHRHHHKFKLLKYGVLFILFLAIGITLFVYSVYAGLWGKLPDYAELRDIRNDEASELYSEDNLLIGKYYVENRTNVNFNHISPYAVKALIATEDVRFYDHSGVDVRGLFRVAKGLLTANTSAGGGSTISQQLAKMLFPRESDLNVFDS